MWPSLKFSCSSGHIWRLDINIFVSLFWWLDACSLGILPWRRPVGLAWRFPGRDWVAVPPFLAFLVASALVFLAIFGGLMKIYLTAYFGGLTLVLRVSCPDVGLLGWLGGFPGVLGWSSRLFLPFWLLRRLFSP